MPYKIEELFTVIEKPLDELLLWAYQESKAEGGYDQFIKSVAEEKNALFKQSNRLDSITEIKQNLIMYRWLFSSLADDASKNVLGALMTQRLLGGCALEAHADAAYASAVNPFTQDRTMRVIVHCGGSCEDILPLLKDDPDIKAFFFEPDNNTFCDIKRNLKGVKKAVLSNLGVFSDDAAFKMQNGDTAEFVSLDAQINEDLDLAILDCDGLALYAIEGMRRHLQRHPPVLSVNASQMLDAVWQIPYRIRTLQPSYGLYLRFDGKHVTLYALPDEINIDFPDRTESDAPVVTLYTCAYHTPEAQIRRAIESVIFQTYRNFEYIFVDNGCTDKTRDIIQEYAEAYPFIRHFRLERNSIYDAGKLMLNEAKGEFLAILDSDDYYEPHFLQRMAEEQQRTGADIVACGTRGESHRNPFNRGIRCYPATLVDPQGLRDIWPDIFNLFRSIWAKLFRLSIYRTLNTEKRAGTGSDTLYVLLYLQQCRTIAIVGDALHVYLEAEDSSSRRFDPAALQYAKVIFEQTNAFLKNTGIFSERNFAYNCHVFLGGIKRSIRFAVDASESPVIQRISFLEDVLADVEVDKALTFMNQREPFYTEVAEAQRQIAERAQDAQAMQFVSAKLHMQEGQHENALIPLFALAKAENAYNGLAQATINRMLGGHALLKGYSPWMSAYPEAAAAVYCQHNRAAAEWLIAQIKTVMDMPYADDIFELLLCLAALDGDSSLFVYSKKLRLHDAVTHGDLKKAEALAEELNELCPQDRMVLYYTIQLLMLLGQNDDAQALADGAMRYYPDDSLLMLPKNVTVIAPYPDEIAR